MKLDSIFIENFRAIGRLSLENLPDAVVLAGPNGCGKSCVLDAIRLLKSVYGSYQQDEWQTWLGEFQINAQRDPRELLPLFQDRSRSLTISASIRLSNAERGFIAANESAAPLNSIILIDEPELHLNPRLVSGLAAFYYRHLASKLNNQLWLVTHSDTLIREAVAQPHFAVFHIHPATAGVVAQASRVQAGEELDRVIIALVGDLATYRPGAKVVVFESTDAVAFDRQMTCALFPEFEQRVNIISAGEKRTVSALYDLLDRARAAGYIPGQFFAITDADDDSPSRAAHHCQWDVYHIENYLLHEQYLLSALRTLGIGHSEFAGGDDVLATLAKCAGETIRGLVAHQLKKKVNRLLVGSIDLEFDPRRDDVAVALTEALARSTDRMQQELATTVSEESLIDLQDQLSRGYSSALEEGTWRKSFRGREVLRRFCQRVLPGVPYESFRSVVLSRMSEAGFRPPGMAAVVETILRS